MRSDVKTTLFLIQQLPSDFLVWQETFQQIRISVLDDQYGHLTGRSEATTPCPHECHHSRKFAFHDGYREIVKPYLKVCPSEFLVRVRLIV